VTLLIRVSYLLEIVRAFEVPLAVYADIVIFYVLEIRCALVRPMLALAVIAALTRSAAPTAPTVREQTVPGIAIKSTHRTLVLVTSGVAEVLGERFHGRERPGAAVTVAATTSNEQMNRFVMGRKTYTAILLKMETDCSFKEGSLG
jgi:hypothetical protein